MTAVQEEIYDDVQYRLSELRHRYGDGVHIISEPYLLTQLATLCSPKTLQPRINVVIESCYRSLLVRVFNREFPRTVTASETRMIESNQEAVYHGSIIDPATRVVTVNIARAGTFPSHICFDMLNLFLNPQGVRQDHLVMDRITNAEGKVTGARIHGTKVGGDVKGRFLIFPDPMGATGSSLIQALRYYKEEVEGTASKIINIHLMVTPEYIRAMKKVHPEVIIYAIRLDRGLSPPQIAGTVPGTHWDEERGLDDRHYIVPGGGGFGEILNNSYV